MMTNFKQRERLQIKFTCNVIAFVMLSQNNSILITFSKLLRFNMRIFRNGAIVTYILISVYRRGIFVYSAWYANYKKAILPAVHFIDKSNRMCNCLHLYIVIGLNLSTSRDMVVRGGLAKTPWATGGCQMTCINYSHEFPHHICVWKTNSCLSDAPRPKHLSIITNSSSNQFGIPIKASGISIIFT